MSKNLVVIAEDDIDLRDLITTHLESIFPVEVLEAANGIEAIEHLKNNNEDSASTDSHRNIPQLKNANEDSTSTDRHTNERQSLLSCLPSMRAIKITAGSVGTVGESFKVCK